MCGRVSQFEALKRFAKAAARAPKKAGPRHNVTPGTPLLVFRKNDTDVRAYWMHWGLPAAHRQLANARAETVAEKGSFRQALTQGRCVVPVDGFYEWQSEGTMRWPWYFYPASNDTAPLWLAAIAAPLSGSEDDTAPALGVCLLTTVANAVMAPVHHRMPVVLDHAGIAQWLAPGTLSGAVLQALTAPAPEDRLQRHRVSPVINHANAPESAELIAPWTPPVEQGELF